MECPYSQVLSLKNLIILGLSASPLAHINMSCLLRSVIRMEVHSWLVCNLFELGRRRSVIRNPPFGVGRSPRTQSTGTF